MSETFLHVDQAEVGHVVYLVEDTPDGPARTEWCERAPAGFTGWLLGETVVQALRLPDDGRRVELLMRAPGFRTAPDSWLYRPWLILDTETTGLDADCRIVELGAVVMQEGRVIEHRAGLFNPGKPIEPGAAAVHGITDDMVRRAPKITAPNPKTGRTPAQGLDALAAKYDCRAIVGYNILHYDLPLLRRELGHTFIELEAGVGPVVDPLVVVRLDSVGRFWTGKGRHRLSAVADRFRLTEPEPGMEAKAHRAAWDCVLAGRILWHLRAHLPTEDRDVRLMMSAEAKSQQQNFDAWKARQPPQQETSG